MYVEELKWLHRKIPGKWRDSWNCAQMACPKHRNGRQKCIVSPKENENTISKVCTVHGHPLQRLYYQEGNHNVSVWNQYLVNTIPLTAQPVTPLNCREADGHGAGDDPALPRHVWWYWGQKMRRARGGEGCNDHQTRPLWGGMCICSHYCARE